MTRATYGIFDNYIFKDRDIADIAANIRERLGLKVYFLVVAISGEIERIIAARIPNAKDDGASNPILRCSIPVPSGR